VLNSSLILAAGCLVVVRICIVMQAVSTSLSDVER
jgi:hypothetical protein